MQALPSQYRPTVAIPYEQFDSTRTPVHDPQLESLKDCVKHTIGVSHNSYNFNITIQDMEEITVDNRW